MKLTRAREVCHQLQFLAANRLDISVVDHCDILRERGYTDEEIIQGCLLLFLTYGRRLDKKFAEQETRLLMI